MCVGEAFKKLLVEVSCFVAKCSTKWFEEESWLVHL